MALSKICTIYNQRYTLTADNLPYEKVGNAEPVCIADEVPFDIPDSWEWVRLGMISTYSHAKKKINAQNADPQTWGLDLEDIEKGGRLLQRKAIGERKAVGDKTCFDCGDILYSKLRPYLLKILVAPDSGICTPEIVPFKVFGNLDPEYIVAFLKCPYVDTVINSVTYGVKMPRVGTDTMTELLVPIPPLSEQKRIVKKLREVTPLAEAYAAAYIRVDELNKEFPELLKKSILYEAVQGKLVPQDSSDEPASLLLERIRAEKQQLIKEGKIKRDKHESVIFRRDNSHYEKRGDEVTCIDTEIPFSIPDSWVWTRISSLGTIVRGCGIKRTETVPEGLPCVRYGEIYTSYNTFFESTKSFISSKLDKLCKHFNYGDIIFTLTGENKVDIAKSVAYLGSIPVAAGGDLAFWTYHGMNPLYLVAFMASPYAISKKVELATGDIIVHISGDKIGSILIPVPPLEEQARIVSHLAKLEDVVNTL